MADRSGLDAGCAGAAAGFEKTGKMQEPHSFNSQNRAAISPRRGDFTKSPTDCGAVLRLKISLEGACADSLFICAHGFASRHDIVAENRAVM